MLSIHLKKTLCLFCDIFFVVILRFLYILEAGIDMLVGSDVEEETEEISELPVYTLSPYPKANPNGTMETKL